MTDVSPSRAGQASRRDLPFIGFWNAWLDSPKATASSRRLPTNNVEFNPVVCLNSDPITPQIASGFLFPPESMENASNPPHHQLTIEICRTPAQGIYELHPQDEHLDHLGCVSASAIFALAEASSHFFLIQNMDALDFDQYIPQLRSCRIKLRAKTDQRIYSIGKFSDRDWKRFHRALLKNHRSLVEFPIHIMNDIGKCIAIVQFDWFVFRKPKRR
jgi:hypothetical protein